LLSLQFEAHLDKCALIWCGFEKAGLGEEGIAVGVFEGGKEGGEQAGREIEGIGGRVGSGCCGGFGV